MRKFSFRCKDRKTNQFRLLCLTDPHFTFLTPLSLSFQVGIYGMKKKVVSEEGGEKRDCSSSLSWLLNQSKEERKRSASTTFVVWGVEEKSFEASHREESRRGFNFFKNFTHDGLRDKRKEKNDESWDEEMRRTVLRSNNPTIKTISVVSSSENKRDISLTPSILFLPSLYPSSKTMIMSFKQCHPSCLKFHKLLTTVTNQDPEWDWKQGTCWWWLIVSQV